MADPGNSGSFAKGSSDPSATKTHPSPKDAKPAFEAVDWRSSTKANASSFTALAMKGGRSPTDPEESAGQVSGQVNALSGAINVQQTRWRSGSITEVHYHVDNPKKGSVRHKDSNGQTFQLKGSRDAFVGKFK